MKELEVFLRQVPRPDVTTPRFKQALRRRLLSSSRYVRGAPWKIAFVSTLVTEMALLGILVAFVAQPDLPIRLNQWIAGSVPKQGYDYAGELSKENDKMLVNNYLARRYQPGSVKLRPLTGEEMVSIRRFELDNGKQILVYTQHKDGPASLPVVY